MNRIVAFLGRWRDLLFWLPAVLVVLTIAYYAIPAIDPRSGIDGFGEVWAALVVAFKAMLAGVIAWLMQHFYFRELRDEDEEFLGWAALGELPEADPSSSAQASAYGMPDSVRNGTTRREDDALRWRARNALIVLTLDRVTWLVPFTLIFAALSAW